MKWRNLAGVAMAAFSAAACTTAGTTSYMENVNPDTGLIEATSTTTVGEGEEARVVSEEKRLVGYAGEQWARDVQAQVQQEHENQMSLIERQAAMQIVIEGFQGAVSPDERLRFADLIMNWMNSMGEANQNMMTEALETNGVDVNDVRAAQIVEECMKVETTDQRGRTVDRFVCR